METKCRYFERLANKPCFLALCELPSSAKSSPNRRLGLGREQCSQLRRRDWPAEQVSLGLVTAMGAKKCHHCVSFYTFGDNP
jgi:hypothetical protein